jgi:hypothetical protein
MNANMATFPSTLDASRPRINSLMESHLPQCRAERADAQLERQFPSRSQ